MTLKKKLCLIYFFKLLINFRFPSEESLRKKWLDVIPSNSNIKKYSVICSLHFKPQDITAHCSVSKLKSDAVPTIFPKIIPPEKEIAVLSHMVIQAAPVIDEEVFVEKPGNISVVPEQKLEISPMPSISEEPPTKKIRYECKEIDDLKREVKVLK